MTISDKVINVLLPEILEQIDYNVLCSTKYDIFDPSLSGAELTVRGSIYEHTLWAISNLASC